MNIQPHPLVRSSAIIADSAEAFAHTQPLLERVSHMKPITPKAEEAPALKPKRFTKHNTFKRNPKTHEPNEGVNAPLPSILKKRPLEADDEGTLPLPEEKRTDSKIRFKDEETFFNDYPRTTLDNTTISSLVSSSEGEAARITLADKAEAFITEYLSGHKETGMDEAIALKEGKEMRRRTLQTDSLRARMARVLDGEEMLALCRIITLHRKYQRLNTALSGQLLTLFLKLPEVERHPFRFNLTETALLNLLDRAKER